MRQSYKIIERHYGDRKAKRSGLPLINHINEGKRLLDKISVEDAVIDAWCLHPLFQNDDELQWNGTHEVEAFPQRVIFLVMEYRHIANMGLRQNIVRKIPEDSFIVRKPHLSPISSVNQMLIADKVQNRKDFLKHQRDHPEWEELNRYFKEWMEVLNISEEQYKKYCEYML